MGALLLVEVEVEHVRIQVEVGRLSEIGEVPALSERRLELGEQGLGIFMVKLLTVGLYLDRDPVRSIPAEEPADLLDPVNLAHLDQAAFLLGHGVENPVEGIHGDEEYLYEVELPQRESFDEPGKWTVRVSEHCGFPTWDEPTEEVFECAIWQFEGPLHQGERLLARETM